MTESDQAFCEVVMKKCQAEEDPENKKEQQKEHQRANNNIMTNRAPKKSVKATEAKIKLHDQKPPKAMTERTKSRNKGDDDVLEKLDAEV